jgi:hypothetical protein
MHRSQHGGFEPSEMIQDSSDFSEVIKQWMAYCQDKEGRLIRSVTRYFCGPISGFKQYSKTRDFWDVKP